MAYSIEKKNQAIKLRKRGYSLNELHIKTGVSKGRLSEWLRDVVLPASGEKRLLTRVKRGQRIWAQNRIKKTNDLLKSYLDDAKSELSEISIDKQTGKILCAMLYWCEGAKDSNTAVYFTNSDPQVIKTFLTFLRQSFTLDESKFRVLVHLHEYHKREQQLKFWAKITSIPLGQFSKLYLKPHTGKRTRENYPGCVSLRYHDV